MADVRAFRALRFHPSLGRDLSPFLCPPYDTVSPAQREEFYRRSPYNIIRLELPRAGERPGETLRRWREEGVLVREERPALYLLEERFGEGARRLVLFARVRVEEFGTGAVLPHEETIAAPREVRFRLLQACRTVVSPILFLYRDSGGLRGLLEEQARHPPEAEAVSWEGVHYRFWALREPSLLEEVHTRLAPQPLFIADGHHRYEASLRYRRWRRGRGGGERPYDFTLGGLVALEDPGLRILPIHRVVSGPPGSLSALRRRVARAFQMEAVPLEGLSPPALEGLLRAVEAQGEIPAYGLVDGGEGRAWLLRLRGSVPPPPVPVLGRCDTWVLHHTALAGEGLEVRFSHSLEEVAGALRRGEASVAFLLRSLRKEVFEGVVGAGQRLPPKSTYFVPKLPTGLVLYPLEEG